MTNQWGSLQFQSAATPQFFKIVEKTQALFICIYLYVIVLTGKNE